MFKSSFIKKITQKEGDVTRPQKEFSLKEFVEGGASSIRPIDSLFEDADYIIYPDYGHYRPNLIFLSRKTLYYTSHDTQDTAFSFFDLKYDARFITGDDSAEIYFGRYESGKFGPSFILTEPKDADSIFFSFLLHRIERPYFALYYRRIHDKTFLVLPLDAEYDTSGACFKTVDDSIAEQRVSFYEGIFEYELARFYGEDVSNLEQTDACHETQEAELLSDESQALVLELSQKYAPKLKLIADVLSISLPAEAVFLPSRIEYFGETFNYNRAEEVARFKSLIERDYRNLSLLKQKVETIELKLNDFFREKLQYFNFKFELSTNIDFSENLATKIVISGKFVQAERDPFWDTAPIFLPRGIYRGSVYGFNATNEDLYIMWTKSSIYRTINRIRPAFDALTAVKEAQESFLAANPTHERTVCEDVRDYRLVRYLDI